MAQSGCQRCKPEEQHACDENCAAAIMVAEPSSQQEETAEAKQVEGLYPLGRWEGYVKISSHNGQGKVDDGDVEGFEEDGGTGQPEEDALTGCEEGGCHGQAF